MRLPKLYSPVRIKFWSLRNKLGANMGMMFDCDEQVERVAMRVLLPNKDWRWNIKDLNKISAYDWYIEQDQEILTEHGRDIEYELVT